MRQEIVDPRIVKQDLFQVLLEPISSNPHKEYIANHVVNTSFTITSAVIEHWPNYGGAGIGDIMMRPNGLGGGTSRKPGNIIIDMRKLMNEVFDGSISAGGVYLSKYLLILTVLNVFRKVYKLREVHLEERQAILLALLWKYKKVEPNTIRPNNLLTNVNSWFNQLNRGGVSDIELWMLMDDLSNLKCIRLNKNGTVSLTEKLILKH
jgi:hypothetical protein